MDEYEERDEAPEESGGEPSAPEREERPDEPEREERPSEPEREERPSEPEPEEQPSEPEPSEPEPEELAPEPEPSEPEPEAPDGEPIESGAISGDTFQDLIGAIDDLNQTITGAVTEQPEPTPGEEPGGGAGGGGGGDVLVTESSSVDLSPVVKVLETTNKRLEQTYELLEHQDEVLVTQHNDLIQLQANVDFVFLAVAALIGVVVGAAIGLVFDRMWRS